MTNMLSATRGNTNIHAKMLDVYRRHTPQSHPGRHAPALRALPADPAQLVDTIGGLFAHYEYDLAGTGFTPTADRLAEVDIRPVHAKLDRVLELDSRPLEHPRPVARRLLGVCRDASILLCSALRTHGIPARMRYGMAYFMYVPNRPLHDHVVVEHWDEAESRWKYADGRMYEEVRAAHGLPDHYRDDIPTSLFLTGAQTWWRSQDPTDPVFTLNGYRLDSDSGRWLARNLLMYDLASLYGWEPQMWDAWGYIRRSRMHARPRGPLQHWKLERLARLDPADPEQWRALMRMYRSLRLVRLTSRVLCCSPVNGRHPVPGLATRRSVHARHR